MPGFDAALGSHTLRRADHTSVSVLLLARIGTLVWPRTEILPIPSISA